MDINVSLPAGGGGMAPEKTTQRAFRRGAGAWPPRKPLSGPSGGGRGHGPREKLPTTISVVNH
jgi:hypothetical protein